MLIRRHRSPDDTVLQLGPRTHAAVSAHVAPWTARVGARLLWRVSRRCCRLRAVASKCNRRARRAFNDVAPLHADSRYVWRRAALPKRHPHPERCRGHVWPSRPRARRLQRDVHEPVSYVPRQRPSAAAGQLVRQRRYRRDPRLQHKPRRRRPSQRGGVARCTLEHQRRFGAHVVPVAVNDSLRGSRAGGPVGQCNAQHHGRPAPAMVAA